MTFTFFVVRRPLDLRCVMVNLYFAHGYEAAQKFVWDAIEQSQTLWRIVFPQPRGHLKQKPLSHMIWLQLLPSRAFSISHQPSPYREFFQLFRCSDLSWVSRTFWVSQAQRTFQPLKFIMQSAFYLFSLSLIRVLVFP